MTDDEKQPVVDDEDVVVEDAVSEDADDTEADEEKPAVPAAVVEPPARRINWSRIAVLGIVPGLAIVLAIVAGYLKWQDNSVRAADTARTESVQAARDIVVDILSYEPDKIDQQLGSARDLLTGDFQKSYTSLTTEVVIPGAKQQQISAVATVPAAASVSASPNHAVVLVFVNQTVTIGRDAPSRTASSVRVTLDKVGDRWLISEFEPV